MIQCDDPFLFRYIEGNAIHRHGDYFLAMLAPQQLIHRNLSMKEIIEVYRQGIKDPAIMDNTCTLGNKAHLLTYHVRTLLDIENFLNPCPTGTIVLGAWRDTAVTQWNDKVVYVSRGRTIPDKSEIRPFIAYKWIQ
jgi:hypothetical protein